MPSSSSISPERWQEIIDAFHAVAEAAPARRGDVLDRICGNDADLRASVQRLLDADADASVLVPKAAGTRLSIEHDPANGRQVGPYRLGEEIGRGGMGVVYRATRADVGNTVAVKMLREQFPSTERTDRFVREQHVLGQLEHPGIARFLDAGVTDDDMPYLVMEYVDGQLVTDAAADMNLRERLRLFLKICDAIRYAHQNLVVHRDLKPSNVMVTTDGTVKLLDFGIAKMLEEDATITATRHRVMTLAYAAPEQVKGGTVSTATDVYALGTLLYELLTGTRPLDLDDIGFPEAVRRILHNMPTAPSARSGTELPERVPASALRGDLDTICLKALRKEPKRRYESVEALRDDLQRYLADRPITARPDSLSYRTGKFVRRNRAGVLSAALSVLILGLVLAFYTTRLADERDRATEQAEISESVTAFLVETLEEGDPNATSGDSLTIFEVIDRAEQRAQNMEDLPLVQANILDAIGRVRFSNGEINKSETLFYESLNIRRRTLSPSHPDVASSLNHIAQAKTVLGKFGEADSVLMQSLSILTAAHGPSSPELVTPARILGQIRYRQGRYESADSLFERVITIHETDSTMHPDSYADTYQKWGMVAHRQGTYDTARERYQRAIDLLSARYPRGSTTIASAYVNLASVERVAGNYQRALEGYNKSLRLTKKLRGDQSILGTLIESNVAVTLQKMGDLDGAEALMRKNVRLREEIFGPAHPRTATAHHILGRILAEQTDIASEAERHFRQALSLRQQAIPDQWQVGATQLELGRLLMNESRFEEAEPLLTAGLIRMMDTRGPDHKASQKGKSDLNELYVRWQHPERYAAIRDSLSDLGYEVEPARMVTTALSTE